MTITNGPMQTKHAVPSAKGDVITIVPGFTAAKSQQTPLSSTWIAVLLSGIKIPSGRFCIIQLQEPA